MYFSLSTGTLYLYVVIEGEEVLLGSNLTPLCFRGIVRQKYIVFPSQKGGCTRYQRKDIDYGPYALCALYLYVVFFLTHRYTVLVQRKCVLEAFYE
jgi:hypothetical protein